MVVKNIDAGNLYAELVKIESFHHAHLMVAANKGDCQTEARCDHCYEPNGPYADLVIDVRP